MPQRVGANRFVDTGALRRSAHGFLQVALVHMVTAELTGFRASGHGRKGYYQPILCWRWGIAGEARAGQQAAAWLNQLVGYFTR
jgi:hypothetical protein